MHTAKAIVKNRVLILIVAAALMIPSVLGMLGTRINYDMLNYLPDTMDAVPQGERMQQIIQQAGFRNVSYKRLVFGMCMLYTAQK